MLKIYNRLWVFGDSHSTPGVCVTPQDSFWGLTAKQLNIDTVINCSRPKIGLDSICHMMVGEQQKFDFDNDFFLIGVPPLERITVFDNHKDTAMYSHTFDTDTWQSQTGLIHSHHGLINMQYHELDRIMVLIQDRSWIETQALRQIFFLTQWLDSQNTNYVMVNLSKNLDKDNKWGPSQYILDYCCNHDRCELFDRSLYDINIDINPPADYQQYGWFGHHGADGNRLFFEKAILPKLC